MEPHWVWLQSLPLPWRVTVTLRDWQDEDLPQVAHYAGEVIDVCTVSASLEVQLSDGRRFTLREEPKVTEDLWFHWEDTLDVRLDHPWHPGRPVFWQPYWCVDLWPDYRASCIAHAMPHVHPHIRGAVVTYQDPQDCRQ